MAHGHLFMFYLHLTAKNTVGRWPSYAESVTTQGLLLNVIVTELYKNMEIWIFFSGETNTFGVLFVSSSFQWYHSFCRRRRLDLAQESDNDEFVLYMYRKAQSELMENSDEYRRFFYCPVWQFRKQLPFSVFSSLL